MTSLRSLLSSNIKKRRKYLGISQAVLAEKVNTSPHYIAQIEQKNRFPTPEMLERIAFALEIDSFDLFSAGPLQAEDIQQFQEGIKADIEERIKKLIKPKKQANK
jgi:transcriptional regulator with XRE-family HTH domain